MKNSPEFQELKVVAREPFHVYYQGSAQAVTATNKVGEFDILPGHADFFSILDPGEVIVTTKSEPVVFSINNGILTARDNEVMIFVNM
jgi:F-type H+-transporting ATPase subunit epsilon